MQDGMMDGIHGQRRITFKRTRPNPLFQSWLQELYNEAVQKDSKLKEMLKEALESISKYPLPLQTGAECAILKGFGKKLCVFLDTKLKIYHSQESNSSDNVLSQNSSHSGASSSNDKPVIIATVDSQNLVGVAQLTDAQSITKSKSPKRSKAYKPSFRSGGYAILMALLFNHRENPSSPCMKEELIEKAQQYSEESFTRPKPESHYTAWSNMARLITKGLVHKTKSRKPEFSLTTAGMSLANELTETHKSTPTANDIIFNDVRQIVAHGNAVDEIPNNEPASEQTENIVMSPGTFDVILLIDKAETSGASKKNDPTVAQFNKYPDLKHEYRHLKVGDFTWVARSRANRDHELVLPFIVERKRMDDLGSSIKDGRFHEQKFRLRKCGLKNVLYLVEHYGSNKHVGLPLPSLMQALANTRVQDGFKIHITDSLTHSARFLAMMTKRLTIEYKDKTLKSGKGESEEVLMVFNYFNKSSAKSRTLTVTETLIKILLQLKGMSVEKALAITSIYKSPKSLIEVYKGCSQREGELLLANLKHNDLSRKVGPIASKAVYQLFTIKDLL